MSLKRALIDVEHMHVQQTSESQDELSNRYLPLLASMTQLTTDDKKSHRARQQEPNQPVPDLKDEIVELLGEFDLPAPVSWRMVRNTIEILDSDKTIPILCTVVGTFPCRLCNEAARNVSWPTGGVNSTMRDDAAATHKPVLEVLGKRMGNWKVLLSKQHAGSESLWFHPCHFTSILCHDMANKSTYSPIRAKLIDLASGCWDWNLAGSDSQRKRLKVPLAWTQCGQKLSILWQVDVGFDEEAEQQVVKVWKIGTPSEVRLLLLSYHSRPKPSPDFTGHRSRYRPSEILPK
ncbi:hypothetical protein V8E54_007028 [Elaphomyces granulatus]